MAATALARHRVAHVRAASVRGERARFRVSADEENLTRAEVALGVLFGTLHGEWQTTRCGGVVLERDSSFARPPPRVLLFRVHEMAGLGDAARGRFGACPAWFQRKENKAQSALFDRIPEPPVEGPEVDEIIALLGAALKADGAALMSITGRTKTMAFGFHTAATYEQALSSFAEDRYEIVTAPSAATWPGATWPASLFRTS